jgi:hypothetical protein
LSPQVREAYLAEAVKASMVEEVKLTPELVAADKLDAAENLELYRKLYLAMMEFVYCDPCAFTSALAVRVRSKYLAAARNKCGRMLLKGIKRVDDGALATALQLATGELGMDGADVDPKVAQVVAKAAALLPKVQKARKMLAVATKAVSERKLTAAVAAAAGCKLVGGTKHGAEYEAAALLLRQVTALRRMAELAADTLVRPCVEAAVAGADEVGWRKNKKVEECRALLQLSAREYAAKEQEAALARGSTRRAVRISKERAQKRLREKADALRGRPLNGYEGLKTPEEYAGKFTVGHLLRGRTTYKENMMKWRRPMGSTMYTCLTRLPRTDRDDSPHLVAKKMFGAVMRVMGDKASGAPEADAAMALSEAHRRCASQLC